MSNANKSGDNRLFQLMIVLITAVVGPLVVFFITNEVKSNQAPTPVQATAAPTVIVVTATNSPAGQVNPTPTPAGITNPKGTLPAGTVALVDNLQLWIDPNDLQVVGPTIGLKIHIHNLDNARRTITYTTGSVMLQDGSGNPYEPYIGDKKQLCKKTDVGLQKTVQVDPGQELVLQSPSLADYGQWCDITAGQILPLFKGPLADGASVLRVMIQKMGPFDGFTIEIKL